MSGIDLGDISIDIDKDKVKVKELNLRPNTRYTFNLPLCGNKSQINDGIEYQGIFRTKNILGNGTVYYIFTDVYIQNKPDKKCSHVESITTLIPQNLKVTSNVEEIHPGGGGKSTRRHRKSTRRHRKSTRR